MYSTKRKTLVLNLTSRAIKFEQLKFLGGVVKPNYTVSKSISANSTRHKFTLFNE